MLLCPYRSSFTSSLSHHGRCRQHNLEELALLDWLIVHTSLFLLNTHCHTELGTFAFAALNQPSLLQQKVSDV